MRGCEVVFVDINLKDFSFNYSDLELELEKRKSDKKTKVIWPTALVGFVPDISKLNKLKNKYNSYLFADLCETTFGEYKNQNILSCFDMCTTSFFWAHQICGIEMGMLFIKKLSNKYLELTENAQMIRSHGLTRVLGKNSETRKQIEINNPEVDPEFLFEKMGTNYRSTDLNAFFCLMDTKRYNKYLKHRKDIWQYFVDKLPKQYKKLNKNIIPFCLPIISQSKDIKSIKHILNQNGWETRPVICYLPINPAFAKFAKNKIYPNSKFLNDNGFYVGLNKDTTKCNIDTLINLIS
jgi:CDP-6-deoxy-D-xylo-4-hexulose-3-dehydrase